MTEHGYRVRGRSSRAIAAAAERFLQQIAPAHLNSGEPLDLAQLVDHGLSAAGIFVYPVSAEELPDAEAETRASADGRIEILMRQEFYDALFEQNSNTNRARSTLAHEIGHAVLHKSELRSGRHRPREFALRRAPRTDLQAYEDSEWQAHMFAGALLMPRPALRRCALLDPFALAGQFDVSEAFARSHLGRVSRIL